MGKYEGGQRRVYKGKLLAQGATFFTLEYLRCFFPPKLILSYLQVWMQKKTMIVKCPVCRSHNFNRVQQGRNQEGRGFCSARDPPFVGLFF